MKASRRGVLAGALALPAIAGLPHAAAARAGKPLLLHDPALTAGRRFAEAYGGESLPIEGDRIRFARAVFERRPSLVVGISRHADAFLIADVGSEAGYVPTGATLGSLRKVIADCRDCDHGGVIAWALSPRA